MRERLQAITRAQDSSRQAHETGEAVREQVDPGQASAFWRRALSGFAAPTSLVVDGLFDPEDGAPVGSAVHREVEVEVARAVVEKIDKLALENSFTRSTILLGAWAILLSRYSGEDDVLFGAPASDSSKGPLPARVHIPEGAKTAPWLSALHQQQLEREAHANCPLSEIVSHSDIPPGAPLFESLLVFANTPDTARDLLISCPLTVTAAPGTPLSLRITYDARRFCAATAARMLAHLQTLLEAISEDPDRAVAELPMLPNAERAQLLLEWSGAPVGPGPDACIHHFFEAQAERTPDAVALVFEEEQLTYGELNARANRLARSLQAAGVGPDVLVGLCVERSFDMIVGVLGILKAGGAYVPLDPSYPAERLSFMLEDASVSVIVTQEKLAGALPPHNARVLRLDADWPAIAVESDRNPTSAVTADHLAYVIYTSGSTGRPKGVLIEHRGVGNLINAQNRAFSLHHDNRILQLASLSFDASVLEMCLAFGTGARLVLGTQASLLPGVNLWRTLKEQRITHAFLMPSILATLPAEDLPSFTDLIVGGEVCPPDLLSRWSSGRRIWHIYGATEGTVWTMFVKVLDCSRKPPIGHPFENAEIYILDRHLRPAPIGVPGELCIGGAGVARGYRNQPDLTRTKFIAHPLREAAGARLYRTGDLGRFLPNGDIEFLGRIDEQVKFRGFRVELGEIEAVLRRAPSVWEAAVILREDRPGDKRIVAYIIPEGEPLSDGALRDHLRKSLPEYMLPSHFVRLASLPLNASGKLDRKRLPAPSFNRSEDGGTYVAPHTPTQEAVARIWSELLGAPSIGVEDNFFDLGAHSLIAARLLSRVNERFGIELPIAAVFENLTIASMADLIDEHYRRQGASRRMPVQRIRREGHLPASFAQERVYFIEQVSPEGRAYQAEFSLHLRGRLDVRALERGLEEMVRRHEIFRTTFPAVDGRLLQVIHSTGPAQLPVIDLQGLPEAQRAAEVERIIHAEAQRPFPLDQLPLVRWTLAKLGEDEHVLIHVEHHMVHDGWSYNVFLRELLEIYQAFAEGRPSPLLDPALQFVDYADWQRRWVLTDEARDQLAYWTEHLSGSPPLLNLPLDRPRPAVQTYRGDQLRVTLPEPLCEALRRVSREEQVTLFMTMLAAFLVVLHRYTAQDDLCVGTAVANRRSRAVEGMIGMIVNNLILRTDLSGDPSFRELLARVRRVSLEAYAREDLPFDKIVEALRPARDLRYNPLFQAMFSFHDAALPALSLPGLDIRTTLAISNKSSKFDLDVVVIPYAEQQIAQKEGAVERTIDVIWEYNTDLFDAATIQRMEASYQALLAGIAADPSARISELPFLTAPQMEWIAAWNATQMAYPSDRCVHEVFEEQVERTPDAAAVVFGDAQLTYRELNARANRLARHLRSLGVGASPDVLVGLCFERSPLMVIAMLGVLKAGGAYVPMDPAYPAEHVAFIVKDAELSVLLTQADLRDKIGEHAGELVCLDADLRAIAQHSEENLGSAVRSHHLAYIIYTSGSTGTPKGAMIEQRSLMNFATSAARAYRITESDRILQFASISFDTAVEEIYPCLTTGATLLLRTEAMLCSSDDFWRIAAEWRVSVLNFPTAFWHQLTAELEPEDTRVPACVRLVIIGGEEAQLEKVRRWHSSVAHLSPPPQLFNGYGPTEGTVTTTLYHCDKAMTTVASVPIGRPLGNAQVVLLDRHLNQAPVGAPGELCIGGLGLARGYWRRPELTAEKFIRNPISYVASDRLYKTGDLARLRPDGELEYLGRLDNQVKIRGFRIELGEIETVLSQHPHVRQALVIVREDVPGHKRLAAYIVRKRPDLSARELRDFLSRKVPSYMVPSAFVLRDALPLTPVGKVDLQALPAPDEVSLCADEQADERGRAPQTPVEAVLLSIWSRTLRAPHIGVHDNFFALGGDSILSIQVVSRARQAGIELTPKQIFQHQTVAELAANAVVVTMGPRSIKALQGAVTGDVPLTPIQRWFFEQRLPDAHYYNQSAVIETPADLNAAHLGRAIEGLVWQHDALRLRYVEEGGRVRQSIAPPDVAAKDGRAVLDIIDLSGVDPAEQKAAVASAADELERSLNLTTGPIARAALFHLGRGLPGRLLLTVHHLAVDAVSWRILLEDLATAYRQLERGEAINLGPKTTSLKEWAERLTEYAASEVLLAELEHWTTASTKFAPLPVDSRAGSAPRSLAKVASVTTTLPERETRALLHDVRTAYNTQINDVLLTALSQSFARFTGARSLVVDLEGHGREELFDDVDLSRTVGWFTTLFPVLLTLPSSDDPGEALKAVKEDLRRIPRRGIGYGVLRYLRGDGSASHLAQALPQAEVSFNYLGQFDQTLEGSTALGPTLDWRFVRGKQGLCSHLLEIGCWIRDGRLETLWTYSGEAYKPATIERLSSDFVAALRALVDHCQAPGVGGYTPSDFSAQKLSQSRLDKLMRKIGEGKQETDR